MSDIRNSLDEAAEALREKAQALFDLEKQCRILCNRDIPRATEEYEAARRKYQGWLRDYAPLEPWGFENFGTELQMDRRPPPVPPPRPNHRGNR